MSRELVGYEGEGRHRKPIWRDLVVDEPKFGHMEPAFQGPVERRFVDPAALATPEPTQPAPVPDRGRYTPQELAERRQRGQAAMRAAIATPEPQEPAVTDNAPDVDALPPSTFTEIAAAALEAARRHELVIAARVAAEAADAALNDALAALNDAWATIGDEGAPQPLVAVLTEPQAASEPREPVAAHPKPAKRQRKDQGVLTSRQEQIVAAVRNAGGSMPRAAEALRTSDANIRATLKSVAEKGLLPADVVPMLPASWAKYAPTVAE